MISTALRVGAPFVSGQYDAGNNVSSIARSVPGHRVALTEYVMRNSTFVICVTERTKLWEQRARRKQRLTCYDHLKAAGWRHLDSLAKGCLIARDLPQGYRLEAGTGYRVSPPWAGPGKHLTKEFEVFALTVMREMSAHNGNPKTVPQADDGSPRLPSIGTQGLRNRFASVRQVWCGAATNEGLRAGWRSEPHQSEEKRHLLRLVPDVVIDLDSLCTYISLLEMCDNYFS